VGGATGGVAARLMDLGIDSAQLDALVGHLTAGKSALVVELEGDSTLKSRLEQDLKAFQVEIVQE
jgi:uncharacterized membrane protein